MNTILINVHQQPSLRERITLLRQRVQDRHQAMTTGSRQLNLAIRGELGHPLVLCSAAGLGFVLGHRRPPQHEARQSSLLATGMELLVLVEYLLKRPEQPTSAAIPHP